MVLQTELTFAGVKLFVTEVVNFLDKLISVVFYNWHTFPSDHKI